MPEADPAVLATAAALATALDADDFTAVEALLHPDVTYRIGGDEHRGPAAVVDSYRNGSALARRLFDRVVFDHTIVGLVGDRTARIDFVDALEVAGDVLEHHSLQDVTVAADGSVVAIVDHPVEGEAACLEAFLARHGRRR
jgi:ketosteroid isomerase-like protein